jgi:hypothetical protein
MRVLLAFAVFGSIMSQPWTALVGYFVLIFIAIAVLWLISVSIECRAVSNSAAGHATDANYIAALENMVVEAEAEVEKLRGEIERLRSATASEPDPKAALFRRVGLNENAPQWLVAAARRAYRAALHPDRHPFRHKSEAERRFIEAEAIFDRIVARG